MITLAFILLLVLAIWLMIRLGGVRRVPAGDRARWREARLTRQRRDMGGGSSNGDAGPSGSPAVPAGGGSFGGAGASGGWGDGSSSSGGDGGGD